MPIPMSMSAVASYAGLPISDGMSLLDVTIDTPRPEPRDVIVRVEAVSVNPADTKRRADLPRSATPVVLGYDAPGTVLAVGSQVTTLTVGDEVYYAGDITRPGSNADYQAVDERIVARKPASLSFAEAAAIPLTAITAWEILFDRFRLSSTSTGSLVILGGAGGVGSATIQFAKRRTALSVYGSASRPESAAWVREVGADGVIDHHDLVASVQSVVPAGVDYLVSPHSGGNIGAFAEIMKPFGEIAAIDDPHGLDIYPLKSKSITWHWELMFTRSMFHTADMIEQKHSLEQVAIMVDAHEYRSPIQVAIGDFTANGLRRAHALVETGRTIGKVVVHR